MSMEPCGNCRFFRWDDMKCTVLGDRKEFMCLPTSPACERFKPKTKNFDVLKFRVWDTMRDCFSPNKYGKLIWSLEEEILGDADEDFSQEKMILERCTGIKDMDGNLIFENDKILFVENLPGGFDLTHKIVVTWNNKRGFWDPFDQIDPRFVKIIGNVHRDAEVSE